ncbi:MAG: class I SAM-dependent RNA methyltransferase [Candidatus Eisenbacteria bacterium]|nr:class I SAM-dependent RNA methyltransferase [Candidatus Eisenbacteria bacterium]
MYEYQRNRRYFAQLPDGIKELGAQELSELGAQDITPEYGGIYFSADKEALYRINYSARLSSRILAPLVSFSCCSTDDLYKKAKQINWADFISLNNTFAVFGNISNSKITNSHYASLCLKDAIVDSFREVSGQRPDVDSRSPDVWLNLYIRHDKAVISLDMSGGSLHRRGYRRASLSAPMQEIVAAAIIRYTKWDGSVPLYDPMCGSGTLLSEALLHYCRIPSGIFRDNFGFAFLPDYDNLLWTNVKREQDRHIRNLPEGLIAGSDISPEAIEISRTNIRNLPHGERIELQILDFRNSEGLKNGVIITNPPYGIRMGNRQELDLLYEALGDFLKKKCKGSAAYIYFGEREFIKKIGLKPAWKKPLKTGGLDGRLVKYELF